VVSNSSFGNRSVAKPLGRRCAPRSARAAGLRGCLLAGVTLLILANANASAGAIAPCNRVASPHGSNRARGTLRHPFATAQRLVNSLRPGQTGCLEAGVYEQDVTIRHGGTARARIALRSYPGQRATIVGRLYLARRAGYTTIAHLTLIGREHGHDCSTMCPSPTINANHTTFVDDDVTNDHAPAICFLLGDAHGAYGPANYTTIEGNRIHDCGALPATNYDHGIYVEESHGSRILSNLIYNNADRGIQLYPQAIGTLIRGNVIDGNGEGVVFGASGRQSSNDNTVEDNIITNSHILYNVYSAYGPGDRVGTGNLVRENCIGGGAMDNVANPGGIRFDHAGFRLWHNLLAVPILSVASLRFSPVLPSHPCRGMRIRRSR
jgi:parallel beta-helix repeat protein